MSAPNESGRKVDVLRVLERHVSLAEQVASPEQVAEARAVFDAVAELVAADREYDAARMALDMAEPRDHESLFPLRIRVEGAAERRDAALAAFGGES